MNLNAKWFLVCGALSAALSVMLGAAAHTLAGLPPLLQSWFHTALQYQQFHALGLMVVGMIAIHFPPSRWITAAGWLMIAGTVLFSGNLYLRSLVDFHALHAATPFGGAAFIFAWLCLAWGGVSARPRPDS